MKKIIQNPIHPLDLDLNNLILIYKKFEEAKRISNNPNEQLAIDMIVQMVSRLINNDASSLQKFMAKSLCKKTISWNQFLNFLDKQSEARQNILKWLMYEMNVRQFKFNKKINLKCIGDFDQITFFQTVNFQDKEYYLMLLDKFKIVLVNKLTGQLVVEHSLKRKKIQYQQKVNERKQRSYINSSATKTSKNFSTLKGKQYNIKLKQSPILYNSNTIESLQIIQKIPNPNNYKICDKAKSYMTLTQEVQIDQQIYLTKQKKRISTLFDMFKQLPLQNSNQLAQFASNKILQKKVQDIDFVELKDKYKKYVQKKKQQNQKIKLITQPVVQNKKENIRNYLKKMYQQNKNLSYNPHKLDTHNTISRINRQNHQKKRIIFQKKEKDKYFIARAFTFLPQYNLFSFALYDFDVMLIQVKREHDHIIILEHDFIKLPKQQQQDKKKNEIIQNICFHYHQITKKYQLLVLVRIDWNRSYIRAFNLILTQIAYKKYMPQYNFSLSKEIFFLEMNFDGILIISEKGFGFHVGGSNGEYYCYKDDWNEQNNYYIEHYKQKFQGDLILSCVDISQQHKKIIFGTAGGAIILIDILTKQILLSKKIINQYITKIKFDQKTNQIFILSADQMIIIYDSNSLQQIQVLRIKNEERLNQKTNNFSLYNFKNEILLYSFGTELRLFNSFIDEEKFNKKKKIQCAYKWRLQRIRDSEVQTKSFITEKQNKVQQIYGVITTKKYFVILTKRLELKLISQKSYKIKYSLILDLSLSENIISFGISNDSKIFAYSLQNLTFRVMNIYTQEIYQSIQVSFKITHIQFLSQNNEYLLVVGCDNGNIIFMPSYSNQVKLSNKTVYAHSKSITSMFIIGDILITTSEDSKMIAWQLPFNIIKYQLYVNQRYSKQYIVQISGYKNLKKLVCRGYSGLIYQIDGIEGRIKEIYDQLGAVNVIGFCFNQQTGELFIVDDNLKLSIFEYVQDKPSKSTISSQKKIESSPLKKAFLRKQSKLIKRKNEIHSVQFLNHWKIKNIQYFQDKDIYFVSIICNFQMKTIVFFCSKGGFYIYEELQNKFKGKYTYAGDFIKNQNNKLFFNQSNKLTSIFKS